MKFNNETIRVAVKEWYEDNEGALKKYGDINEWDTSEVTDMSDLFGDSLLEQLGISFLLKYTFNPSVSKWNVSKVTNMQNMFKGRSNFNRDLSSWDVSNVINMRRMFGGCWEFNQPLNNWDVSRLFRTKSCFWQANVNRKV
jgi:surface protein